VNVVDAVASARRDNPRVRAICTPTYEAALAAAPPNGPLHGVPFTLKDVWGVRGLPTTHGSWMARDRVAAEHGAPCSAFGAAGAVLVGKTNLCDLGMTPECESYFGGVTVHPRDSTRTAGGSSGGAAAAVACGMSAFDWGSDLGGSIRLPAAFCGVYGMRLSASSWPVPSEGGRVRTRVDRLLNGMGPITKNLDTMSSVLDAAAPMRRSAPAQPRFRGFLVLTPDRFSEGRWPSFAGDIAQISPSWPSLLPRPEALDRLFVDVLATLVDESLEGRVGAVASALSGVGPRLGDRRLHPRSARVLLELSLLKLGRRPRAAIERTMALRERVGALFSEGYILVSPTTTYPAPRLGRALSMAGLASFVKIGNLLDATALSVPFGTFEGGLPRGLQLMGPAGSEGRLIEIARPLAGP